MNITNGGQHSVASGERSSNNSFDATSSVFPETELPPTHCSSFAKDLVYVQAGRGDGERFDVIH